MTSAQVGESPQTCCPNCHTVFEVTADLLESSDTRVRCGECLSVFDALANLSEPGFTESSTTEGSAEVSEAQDAEHPVHQASVLNDTGAAALAGLTRNTSAIDTDDTDLFSEDAGLPAVEYAARQNDAADKKDSADDKDAQHAFFDSDPNEQESTAGKAEHATDSTGQIAAAALTRQVDFVTNDTPREPLVFRYQDKEPEISDSSESSQVSEVEAIIERARAATSGKSLPPVEAQSTSKPWVLRTSLLALGLLLCALLFGFRERERLLSSPQVRPMLAAACGLLACNLPPYVDVSAFRTVKRTAFSHPNINDALIIDLAFVNDAPFQQPYPELELKLTDLTGRLVVKNRFAPSDYAENWISGKQINVGERVSVNLSVQDPGDDVTSFIVDFH